MAPESPRAPRLEILPFSPFMTHAFLSSVARRVALRLRRSAVCVSAAAGVLPDAPTACVSAARVHRPLALRTAAWLCVCAALGAGAALPLGAHARIKATHPSVN